jgi:hypothetical protein
MQRWIAAGLVVLVLFLGGSYYAYRVYQENQPHPMWVPLPINPELEITKRDEVIKKLLHELTQPEILEKVSKDMDLTTQWGLPSDSQCAKELASRIFVKPGEADSPMGKMPAIHVGVKGKEKDSVETGKIAMRLMTDVWRILGIKPPEK